VTVASSSSSTKALKALGEEATNLEKVSRARSFAHRSACNLWNAVNYLLGVLALVASALAALTTFLNPSQAARLHQHAATSYAQLQGKFRRFRVIDELLDPVASALSAELDATVTEFDQVDAASPPIPWWARRKHGLHHGQAEPSANDHERRGHSG
jgi:hypothetical protein